MTGGCEEETGKALEKVAQKAECGYATAFQYKKIKEAGLRDRVADGHHRYAICQKYGLSFKTEELDMDDEDDVMIWMIDNQNESRRNIETPAKIRMGLKKKSILDKKAQKRKLTNLKQNSTDKENFPEREEKGQVRDIIGKNVGVSGKTVDKFKYIEENAPNLADDLCAGKVVEKKKLSIDGVYRDLRKEEHKATLKEAQFPEGKYRIIYADPPWDYKTGENSKNTAVLQARQTKHQLYTLEVD